MTYELIFFCGLFVGLFVVCITKFTLKLLMVTFSWTLLFVLHLNGALSQLIYYVGFWDFFKPFN